MKENNVQFLNTNKYPFEKRVFIEGQQVLLEHENSRGLSLNEYYGPSEDVCERIILMLSGNSICFFSVEDVYIINDNKNNHRSLLFAFDSPDDILCAQEAGEMYRSCEFCIDGHITSITKTDTALLITCFEVPIEFELKRKPDFPVLLSCAAPDSIHQISYNTVEKRVFTGLLLNDHLPPFKFSSFMTSEETEFMDVLECLAHDLRSFTCGMGINAGHWFLLDDHESKTYHPGWKNSAHQLVKLTTLHMKTDPNDEKGEDVTILTPWGLTKVPLIDFLLDICCLVLPGYTLVCTPTKSYLIDVEVDRVDGIDYNYTEEEVGLRIDPKLFEISDDAEEEAKREQDRKFIFTDYLNESLKKTGDKEGFLIGIMFDENDELVIYSHIYAHPDDGSHLPNEEIRVKE